jgi:hypothetical protein
VGAGAQHTAVGSWIQRHSRALDLVSGETHVRSAPKKSLSKLNTEAFAATFERTFHGRQAMISVQVFCTACSASTTGRAELLSTHQGAIAVDYRYIELGRSGHKANLDLKQENYVPCARLPAVSAFGRSRYSPWAQWHSVGTPIAAGAWCQVRSPRRHVCRAGDVPWGYQFCIIWTAVEGGGGGSGDLDTKTQGKSHSDPPPGPLGCWRQALVGIGTAVLRFLAHRVGRVGY